MITSRSVAGTGTASVISDPVTGQPLDLQTTDGATSMWVVDGIGNPNAAITDAGVKAYEVYYDPYGTERITADDKASVQWQQNPYGFKAGLRSSSTDNGLTKFGYRWQSSTTGGCIQRDTLDAPLGPSNANRYGFAGDDPADASDSTGCDYESVPIPNFSWEDYGYTVAGAAAIGLKDPELGLAFGVGVAFYPQEKALVHNAIVLIANGYQRLVCGGLQYINSIANTGESCY